MFVDTHTHLYDEAFEADRHEVIQRAIDAGVEILLLPAIDSQSHSIQDNLANRYPNVFRQMMGVHPTSIKEDIEHEWSIAEQLLTQHPERYVAVGEIGLDFYWDTTYQEQQYELLRRQLHLAKKLNKPVSLHIRNAYTEFFDFLHTLPYKTYEGVLHCYSGTIEQAQLALELGFHIGVGGTLTYKKSTIPEIVKAVPLNRILLETDAPYLSPVPYRGRRNESAYIPIIANHISQIKEITPDKVAEQTSENARILFGF